MRFIDVLRWLRIHFLWMDGMVALAARVGRRAAAGGWSLALSRAAWAALPRRESVSGQERESGCASGANPLGSVCALRVRRYVVLALFVMAWLLQVRWREGRDVR